MDSALNRDSLLRATSSLELLGNGWRPGDAELECARFVEKWIILRPNQGMPYFMMGIAWSLPVKREVIFAAVLALDQSAGWARLWNEWVVIGETMDGAPAIDADAIQCAGSAWLNSAIRQWVPSN